MKLVNFMSILAAIRNIEGIVKSNPTEFYRKKNLRIVDGRAVDISRVPFQVVVEKYYKFNCGGSLISHYHVLTAGHCIDHVSDRNKHNIQTAMNKWECLTQAIKLVDGLVEGRLHVIGNDFDCKPETEKLWRAQTFEVRVRAGISIGASHNILMEVQKVRLPANYNYNPLKNDIGIIRLKDQATYSKLLQPIGLNTKWPQVGDICTVTGYGFQNGSYFTYPETTLKMVHLEVFHRANCAWMARDGICAGTVNGKEGACHGDSGSPLTIDGLLAGVASSVIACGLYRTPGAFTNVRYHHDWINKCMSNMDVGGFGC